jgi:histidyl-tRNA synthetase
MAGYEQQFESSGFSILKRATLEKAPANPRERAELVAKALDAGNEQIIKAVALQIKAGADAPGEPAVLMLPTDERLDLKLVSKLLGLEVDYYPQERIENMFGSPMTALSVVGAAMKRIPVIADGRVFDSEKIVIASGNPTDEWLVNAEDVRAYVGKCGSTLSLIDLETAKQGGKGGIIEPRLLKGFRDYLPEEMLPRQEMIGKVTRVFERFGFVPLQTPALEYSDILLGKMGADSEKLLFRFKDNGGRDVCLHYDLTVPLARVAAQYPDLPKPFKRYQIAPVWRAENPGRGRFREFFQCDCDIVGAPSLIYDAECITLGLSTMQELGVRVEIRFSNRKVIGVLSKSLNIVDENQVAALARTIDKLPSQGKERVLQLLKTDVNCSPEQIAKIMSVMEISGGNEEMLTKLEQALGAEGAVAVDELRKVNSYVAEMTDSVGSNSNLKLDFSIVRGLDYYTGTVYETFLSDLPGFGSVMSGGRYDGLIERYSGKPTPAVGISVGLDRLLAGLIELGSIKKSSATSRVMVVPMDASCIAAALKVLGQLRKAGIASEMSLENDQKPKMDKQLSLAGKKGIPYAAILGSNEVAKGTLMLKDLNARQQEEVSVTAAIERLKKT